MDDNILYIFDKIYNSNGGTITWNGIIQIVMSPEYIAAYGEESSNVTKKLFKTEFLIPVGEQTGAGEVYKITERGKEAYLNALANIQERVNEINEAKRLQKLQVDQLQSVIDTNISVRNTNMVMKISAITTACIIAATLFVSYLQYAKSADVGVKGLDSLYKEIHLLRLDVQKHTQETIPFQNNPSSRGKVLLTK